MGLAKEVEVMPNSAAVSFIRFTKAFSPPTCSAMATAASLPEQRSRPYSNSSRVSSSPSCRYMEDPSV